jgi:hypothetical protein
MNQLAIDWIIYLVTVALAFLVVLWPSKKGGQK